MTAALLSVRRRRAPAVEVLDRYQRDFGVKTSDLMDGVEALTRVLMTGYAGAKTLNRWLVKRLPVSRRHLTSAWLQKCIRYQCFGIVAECGVRRRFLRYS